MNHAPMDDDDPPDPRMVLGSFIFQHMVASAGMDEEEEDDSLKCPVCNERHEFQEAAESRLSHGAMNVFVSTHCPICLEDSPNPPMAALACGHLVCMQDFERLGGLTASRGPEASSRSSQSRRLERGSNGGPDLSGMPFPPGISSPEEFLDFVMFMAYRGEQDDGYPDSEEEEDYQEDGEDNDDDDMPLLEAMIGEDDANVPPLQNSRGGRDSSRDDEDFFMDFDDRQVQCLAHRYVERTSARSTSSGVWIWLPHGDHMDVFFVDKEQNCAQMEPTFPLDARPVFHPKGLYVTCAPDGGNSNNKWAVQYVTLNRDTTEKYLIPQEAEFVSDGHGGLWALSLHGNAKRLAFYNSRNRNGRVKRTVPVTSHVYMDNTGGAWVHVRKRGENNDMEVGLWHFTTRGSTHRGDIDEHALCVADDHGGIWVVDSQGGQTRLCHYYADEDRPVSTFTFPQGECPFSRDISIVPITGENDMSSVYLHCKRGQEWKLCVANAVGLASEICELPQSSKIVGDGEGGAWLLTFVQRNSTCRALFHVDRHHQVSTQGTVFPADADLIGW